MTHNGFYVNLLKSHNNYLLRDDREQREEGRKMGGAKGTGGVGMGVALGAEAGLMYLTLHPEGPPFLICFRFKGIIT